MVAERVRFSLPERFQGGCDRETRRIRVDCGRLIGTGDWHIEGLEKLLERKKRRRSTLVDVVSTLFFISPTSHSHFDPATAVEFPSGTTPPFHPRQTGPSSTSFYSHFWFVEDLKEVGVVLAPKIRDLDNTGFPTAIEGHAHEARG